MERLSEAYLAGVNPMGQGIDDHAHGIPRDQCPYPSDSPAAAEWLKGWEHGAEADGSNTA